MFAVLVCICVCVLYVTLTATHDWSQTWVLTDDSRLNVTNQNGLKLNFDSNPDLWSHSFDLKSMHKVWKKKKNWMPFCGPLWIFLIKHAVCLTNMMNAFPFSLSILNPVLFASIFIFAYFTCFSVVPGSLQPLVDQWYTAELLAVQCIMSTTYMGQKM